jgi:hypothetical protein
MPIARFQMPDGRIARFEVPEGTTPEEAQKLIAESFDLQNIEQPQQETRSEIARTGQLLARGAIPTLTGAGAGALVGGAPGALVGSLALPMADLAAIGSRYVENLIRQARGLPETKGFSPSGEVSKALANIGLPEPTTTGERVIEAAGGGLAGVGTQLPALGRLATTASTEAGRTLASRLAQTPVAQTVVAAPAASTAQYVGETTESPLAGMAAGMAVGSTAGLRPRKVEPALSAEQLALRADIAYRNAEKAGVIVSPDSLKAKVPQFEKVLKEEGFVPGLHPQLDTVLGEFQKQIETPKTLKELDQLRRTLKAPAKFFENPDQQRITGKLIDEFDDYVKNLSAKDLAIEGGKVKTATKELTKARNFYARSRKADEIDELFRRAEIRAGANFTQSGLENALRQELKTLSLNKKRFSMFSKTEQDAIESAAKGGSIQNILRNIGKYAATSPIPTTGGSALGAGIGALLTGGSPVGAAIGAATVPAVGGAARAGATRMGLNRLEEIQRMVSLGRMPEIQARTQLVPVTGLRGLLASPVDQQFEEQQ